VAGFVTALHTRNYLRDLVETVREDITGTFLDILSVVRTGNPL